MELQLSNFEKGGTAGKVELADKVFANDFNEALVHQVVTAYLAGGRAGTKAQKTRSEVRGGGAKPWKQKGTGRARAGTASSPIWRSGGVTFAPKPQDHTQKVNKKMYRAAIRSILSELIRQERLIVVETMDMKEAKTKQLASQLNKLKLDNVLLVTHEANENLNLAAQNIPHVSVCDVNKVDPVSLVRFEKVVLTVPAAKHFEEVLA